MAKKIRFPLEMAEGRLVKELDEFQRYFDLEKAVAYFCNGRLQKWLENTYNDDILEELGNLTGQEEDFAERFTDILGVEYTPGEKTDVQKLMKDSVVKERLKLFFTDGEAERIAEMTAETQQDLERLATEGKDHIYLLSGTFQIPKNIKETTFEGIGDPKITFEEADEKKVQDQCLRFLNISPTDEHSKRSMQSKGGWEDLTLELLDVLELFLEQV